MYGWTKKTIENILLQLDDIALPFEKYSFKRVNNELKILGSGQSAIVFEGTDRKNRKKEFAIKVIGFSDKHINSEEFIQTIQLQKQMSEIENHIVRVYDYKELRVYIKGEDEVITKPTKDSHHIDLQFVVMEKLKAVIKVDKKLIPHLYPEKLINRDMTEVYKLATNICNALLVSHEKKLLHRDIKLENIFYDDRKKIYKLGDFGIAKLTNDGLAETRAFTKGYGAPEVVKENSEKYDETADIYSLGIVLFIILNGLKFPGSNCYSPNVKEQYSNGYIIEKPDNVDESIFHIVEKMCRFMPDDRQQSISQVVDELDSIVINSDIYILRKYDNAPRIMSILMLVVGVFILLFCLFSNKDINPEQYRWAGILSIALSALLNVEYVSIHNRDIDVKIPYVGLDILWTMQLLVFVLIANYGKVRGGIWIFSAGELILFGFVGGIFCVLWIIRIIFLKILKHSR